MTSNGAAVQPIRRSLQQAAALAVGYVVLIFLLPANKATMRMYHLSVLEYRTVLFAVAIPSLVAWLAAFIGYAKLRQYVTMIRHSPEGAHLDRLATGCTWLAWSLPVPTIVYLILDAVANKWPGFQAADIIIGNYVSLLLPLVAFTVVGAASRGLVRQARLELSLKSVRTIILLFVAGGVLYCYLIFRAVDLNSLGSTHNDYALPIWLVALSIIIPYLYAWFTGLLAAYEITLFSHQVKGVLYRHALRFLAGGLSLIIVSSVALQYTDSVGPSVGHLVLSYRLVLTIIFRLMGAGGFVLLTIGAARLKRIEEV